MAGRKGLSAEDMELWAAYSRTLSRLLPGRSHLPTPPEAPHLEPPTPSPTTPSTPPRNKPQGIPARLDINAPPIGLDKSTWAKFKMQKIKAEARLDLHGLTATRAHAEVFRFLQLSYATDLRCVEIITGNGEVLARELPHWLNAPTLRPLILSLAHPHRRNSGSIRILLRRRG